jgi:hypothetical protein
MSSTRINARPASRWMGLLGAAVAVAPGFARAQPLDLFYERTVMSAAGERCDLFTPQVAKALAAAAVQARGAALRSGASPDRLETAERTARVRAGQADCRSPELATAAQRVRQGFAGFSRVARLTYPGDVGVWHADRAGGPGDPWRLRQDAAFGPDRMSFGLAGRAWPDALVAAARFADGQAPYAARLVLRDTNRSLGPYLDRTRGGPTAGLPLARRMPPPGALTSFMAEARAPAGDDLLGKGPQGWAFRFPPQAVRAIAALDPREAIAVEFLFRGDRVRRAYVEVGDFAAGQAFLQMAAR